MKTKLLTAILLVVASMSWTNALYGQEYQSGTFLKITQLHVDANRPAMPQYSNTLYFTLSDMSWLPATCSLSLIALPDTEKAAAAALLSAVSANKPVKVYIDDSLKTGLFCNAVIVILRGW